MSIVDVGLSQHNFAYTSTAIGPTQPVTTGNWVSVGVNSIASGDLRGSFGTSVITKSSGTATIGTPILDKAENFYYSDAGGLFTQRTEIWRVPITGSGSLVLACADAASNGIWFMTEIKSDSGLLFIEASAASTPTERTVQSSTEECGVLTTAGAGFLVGVGGDETTADVTYGPFSDNEIASFGGASGPTGWMQGKTTTGAVTNYALTVGASYAIRSAGVSVAYTETSGGGSATVTPVGFGLSMSLGAPTVLRSGVRMSATGFGLTVILGAPNVSTNANRTVAPIGFGLTATLGSFTTRNDITLTGVTGFGLTTSLGAPTVTRASSPTVTPTGFGLSVSLGSPTRSASRTATPTGFGLTISLGSPSIPRDRDPFRVRGPTLAVTVGQQAGTTSAAASLTAGLATTSARASLIIGTPNTTATVP